MTNRSAPVWARSALRAWWLLCLLALFATALADAKGTYKATVRVRNAGPSGNVEYTLRLDDRSRLSLDVHRTARFDTDRRALEENGDVLRYLRFDETLKLTGYWDQDGDEVHLTFDRINYGDDYDSRKVRMTFRSDGDTLRNHGWDQDFFGKAPNVDFRKQSGGSKIKTSDILIGAAIIAAGAAIISANQHRGGDELNYETGGDGTFRFGNGDRSVVDKIRFQLKKDGSAEITLKGSFEIKLKGKWKKRNDNYTIEMREIVVDGRTSPADGDATMFMRPDRKTVRTFSTDLDIDGSRRSGTISFRADAG